MTPEQEQTYRKAADNLLALANGETLQVHRHESFFDMLASNPELYTAQQFAEMRIKPKPAVFYSNYYGGDDWRGHYDTLDNALSDAGTNAIRTGVKFVEDL